MKKRDLMVDLQEEYNKWRIAGMEASEGTNIPFTWDCGESSAREDFSDFANLDNVISFEDMLNLENNF